MPVCAFKQIQVLFPAPKQNNPNLLLIGETVGLFFFIPKIQKWRNGGEQTYLLSAVDISEYIYFLQPLMCQIKKTAYIK